LLMISSTCFLLIVYSHATPTTAIYTLSLHDALPISKAGKIGRCSEGELDIGMPALEAVHQLLQEERLRQVIHRHWTQAAQRIDIDRKSTRLNSSHVKISYAVFCLKKKKKKK